MAEAARKPDLQARRGLLGLVRRLNFNHKLEAERRLKADRTFAVGRRLEVGRKQADHTTADRKPEVDRRSYRVIDSQRCWSALG